jgi:hypothetical protein
LSAEAGEGSGGFDGAGDRGEGEEKGEEGKKVAEVR